MSIEAAVNALVGLSLMALCGWGGYWHGADHRLFRPAWILWSAFTILVMAVERRWWSVAVVVPSLVLWALPRRNRQSR
jgi:hypothetical protein